MGAQLFYLLVRDRFQNPLIAVGEEEAEVANTEVDSDVVCAYYPGIPDNVHRFNCKTRMYGRYVRVTAVNVSTYLNLYEIEVIGFN